ncbi:MAG: 4-hydroxythreonine-4-phosphate dehydrogenase, partial [Erythrobacter sp.]
MSPSPSPASPPLAVALGDPAGIGPEIIVESYLRTKGESAPFYVVGGPQVLRTAAQVRGLDCPIVPIAEPEEAIAAFAAGLPVLGGLDASYR